MEKFDCIVIGSGISGMTYAKKAAESGKTVLVLEKKDYAGGCLRTLRYDDFWLELGGHTAYRSYRSLIKSARDMGMNDRLIQRGKAPFKMLNNGQISSIFSSISKLEMALNLPKIFGAKKDGRTVREYYSAFAGKGNYENALSIMFQAVISQEASDFPADMLFKKREKDKTAPANFTIQGGMSSVIEAIAQMDKVTVKTGSEAVDVESSDGTYTVEIQTGEKFQAANLIMGCTPPVTAKLLENTAPEVSGILGSIKGVKVESMGVVTKASDMKIEPFSFIVTKDPAFTSAVSRDVLPHEKYRGAAFHFREGALDSEGKMALIEDVLGIDRGDILAKGETVHYMPSLDMTHKTKMEKLDAELAKIKGLEITGNYFGGLALEDCSLRSLNL